MTWRSIKQIAPGEGRELGAEGRRSALCPKRAASGPAAAKRAWTKEQIRRARRTPLAPLLRKRGYRLRKKPRGNHQVEGEDDLVVKEHYWVWNSREARGNAIDFFMLVESVSFNEAMEILTEEA